MKSLRTLLILALATQSALLALPASAQEEASEENLCIMCHGNEDFWEGDTLRLFVPEKALADDIHWRNGVRCKDCHGGDSKSTQLREAHAAENGFRKVESPADIPDFCGRCHSDPEAMRPFAPGGPTGQPAAFEQSVHGQYLKSAPQDPRAPTCTSCHPKHATRAADDPESATHPSRLVETCGACHETERGELLASVHKAAGEQNSAGGAAPLSCAACHGDDAHALRPVQDMASPVFVQHQVRSCGRCHEQDLQSYRSSVHGHGLERSGLLRSAVCASCHGAHGIFKADDARSTLYATRVADTCAKCHRFIEERLQKSVHGRGDGLGGVAQKAAPGGGIKRRPSCTDCHQGHDLPDPRSSAFRVAEPHRCGGCHTDLNRRYGMSLHGQLTELGQAQAAKCSDCHGAHDILPIRDERSRLSPQNRLNTCRRCHPNAPPNFTAFDPHADPRDRNRSASLFYASFFMEALLYCVFGFFGIHAVCWLVRSWLYRWRHGRPGGLAPGRTAYVRFEPIHRNLHIVLIVTFLGLALTGLPLRYSSQPWASRLASALGGFPNTSVLHRLCALLMLIGFAAHLCSLARRTFQRREKKTPWTTRLFGPDSPLPNVRDVRDFWAMTRWFFGRGPKPVHERWTYWEKFDYFAVFWGVVIIGTSGLIQWFPGFFCQYLPGWTLNFAQVVHSQEALLATGFIFAIHFVHTHLRGERFPIDLCMLTGLVSEEELQEDRPEFIERMRKQGKLDSLRTTTPTSKTLWLARLGGFLALAVGLLLLAGLVRTLLG